MTRLQALEAVAEAARKWQQTTMHIEPHSDEECEAYEEFEDALAALDALPADPAPAEVALFGTVQGERCLGDPSSRFASKLLMDGWTRLGTVRLPLVKGDGA